MKLRKQGKNVDIISKTHAAVQNFGEGAVTADHWIFRHVKNGSPNCKILVIDEITQIEIQLWNDIAKAALKNIQFILSGDFRQFQAIAEHWCGTSVKEGALKNSDMLLDLAGGYFLELTENQRSDQILFDFYTGIWEVNLEQALQKGRQDFPTTKKPANFTLVISHEKRKNVNRERNLQDKQTKSEGTIFLKAPKITAQGNIPQNMFIWKGLRLLGAGGKCLKGVFYEVKSYDAESVTLTTEQKLTHDETVKSLRLSYAITYASSQGLTLHGRVRLEDTDNRYFGLRHLYVGSSRCTSSGLLEIA